MTPGTGAAEPEGGGTIDLRVVAGRPTDEELAAVTAVLHAAVREQAAISEAPAAPDGRHWQLANGFLRSPIVPGPGAWRSF